MSQQRAFAQKLNKKSASDARSDLRRQIVSTGSFKTVDFPASVSRASLSHGIPIYDVVDPVDFEECVNQRKTNSYDSGSFTNWNIRQFGDFPPDDLDLKYIPRENLYLDSPLPSDLTIAKLDLHVKDVLASYSCNFVAVNRKYEQYSTGEVYKRKCGEKIAIVQCLPRQNFEVDLDESSGEEASQRASYASGQSDSTAGSAATGNCVESLGTARESWASSGCDLQQSAADPIIPGVVDRVSPIQMDTMNDGKREKNRQLQLFGLYPLQHEDEVVEKRQVPPLPSECKGHRLFLKILSLRMEFEFEPIFASAALYDAKEKKKVSENFYFDCNPHVIKGMLNSHVPYQDMSTLSRSAVFSIMHASNDLFLVFRLEKVLQAGDIDEACDAYLKEDKNKEKLKISALDYCERLGAYRMPFAWTAIDLSKVINGAATLERSESVPPTPQSATVGDPYPSDTDSIVSTSTFDRHSQVSTTGTLKRIGSSVQGQSPFVRKNSFRSSGRHQQKDDAAEIDSFRPLTLTVNNFFKQESEKLSDDDLFKYLAEVRRPSSLTKKLKCIPGMLKIDISPYSEEISNCLSPELLRINPFHAEEPNFVKEILEFPLKEVYSPNYGYRNLLYVYPKCVNFSSRPGSARNISIKVQLMQGQDQILQAIFGKSSCPAVSQSYCTTINYHAKSPQFYDEIKIKLPTDLNDSHHLLFTFYHVSCRPKTALESSAFETAIGYAWLPLFGNNQLPSGEYNLPVSLDPLPPCYFYLAPDVNLPNVKWLDNHKLVFNLKIEAVTTVYTQDKHLDTFLHSYHVLQSSTNVPATLNELEMQKIIKNLTKSKPEPLVKFLYVVLDKLVDLMVNPPIVHNQIWNVGQTCFEMFGQIAKILTFLVDGFCDQHNRSSLLTAYIQYSNISQPGSEHSSRCGSVENNTSARTPYAPTHPHLDIRRTSSEPEVGPPLSPGHADLMDIIRGFEKSPIFRPAPGDPAAHQRSVSTKKLLHEEMALQWVVSNGAAREMACGNAWFFFEMITKSMGEYLLTTKRIYLARKLRFSQQFVDDVTTLITTLTSEVISRCGKDMRLVQNLNCSMAFFLRDAMSLMDRTCVFNLIRAYCKQMMAKVSTLPESAANLLLLKLEFLRIICSHEHYVTLNLPFAVGPLPVVSQTATSTGIAPPPSPSPSLSSRSSGGSVTVSSTTSANSIGAAELTVDYRCHHYLTGLVLTDLASVLESRNRLLHNKAINIVRNLLSAHDFDPRLADSVVKSKIAALYFPLLGIVMDAYAQLFDPYGQRAKPNNTSNSNASANTTAAEDEHVFEGYMAPGLNPNIAMVIAVGASQTSNAERGGSSVGTMTGRRTTLSFDATRNLLVCFCWVVKNLDHVILRQWLSELSQLRLTQLLDILQLAVSCFEYKGRGVQKEKASRGVKASELKSKLEDTLFGVNSARLELISRSKSSSTQQNENVVTTTDSTIGGVRWRKEHIQYRQNVDPGVGNFVDKMRFELDNDPTSEGNLSTEINLIVLDMLELIGKVLATGELAASGVLNLVTRVLLHMLACNQSVSASQHLFASQRAVVAKYPDLLFEEETEQCADLCLQLLRHCAGRLQPIRAQAAASLYLLLRQGFESGSNFARVKMQITVSLSSLVGKAADGKWFNEENLRRSLKTVLTYAESDVAYPELADTTFCEQVKDLVFNLHMILSDTVKMKEFQHDFEMLIDLMYRIAKGYQNSPDLRLTWLQSLAQKHYERLNYAEAGQCYVHAAALAAEYMHMLEDLEHLPKGAVSFLKLSDNVLEESAVSDDVVSPDEEGICVSGHFTETGLSLLLEQGATMFQQAQMYEASHMMYKILLAIYENQRNYQKISSIYATLAECLVKVDTKYPSADKRMFGTFFRVGFYGHRFGDLDGQEFVYREPAITKLPEVSHRLEAFYSERFGSGVVDVIKDSNNVDRNRLDTEKAYLQITYVEPYFESWELRRRSTQFELNFNVRRFVYATPFTLDGRAHGELKEQYKRKTILTTANSFPYVKTRIQVVHKEQFVLTPIEVAIEDVRKKTKELGLATSQEPRDAKMLQMVLQGCIGTTVNQGPLEIANVFLSGIVDGRKPIDKLQNKLRLSFKDFSKKCLDALRENKRLIGPDQKEYHRELERNYIRFTERLAPMVSVLLTASLRSHHRSSRSENAKSTASLDDDIVSTV